MKKWRTHEEHSPPGAYHFGWVHPKTGLVFQARRGWDHASQADELGFRGDTDTETNDKAIEAGHTRWYVTGDEIGVHFNKDHPDAPQRAKETLAYHAQNQKGRMLLADTGTDYYHGTSLKDAHDFIDRVSTKLNNGRRRETDFMRLKRALGEATRLPDLGVRDLKATKSTLKYDWSQHRPEWDRSGFNAWIDEHGSVYTGREAHVDMLDRPRHRSNEDAIRDHHVRAYAILDPKANFEGSGRELAVHFRGDSPVAAQHAAQFVRDHHRAGMPIVVDKTDPSGATVTDSRTHRSKASALQHITSSRKETDYARMKRELGESRADTLIRMALEEAAIDPDWERKGYAWRRSRKVDRDLHHTIRKAFASRTAYKILDSDPEVRNCTWTAGGCSVAAQALHRVLGGELHAVLNHKGEQSHAVLKHPNGRYYDAEGEHTESEMLDKMRHLERVIEPRIGHFNPHDRDAYGGRPETVDVLAAHLQKSLSKKPLKEADALIRTPLNEAEHEDEHIINAMHTAKQRGGYLNCKLAVQMATGIPKVTELPKVKKHQPGDVLSWGPTHYAIALSNNRAVHVPEWGGEVETAHLDDLKDELGPPQAIHRPPPGVYRRPA